MQKTSATKKDVVCFDSPFAANESYLDRIADALLKRGGFYFYADVNKQTI
jgi:hypothetical protein